MTLISTLQMKRDSVVKRKRASAGGWWVLLVCLCGSAIAYLSQTLMLQSFVLLFASFLLGIMSVAV